MIKNKPLKIILALLGFLVVGAIGFFSWRSIKEIDNINHLVNQNLIKKTEEPAVNEKDTSNWDVYTNEEYGFELKFPPAWKGVRIETSESPQGSHYISFTYPKEISQKMNPGEVGFFIGILSKETWQNLQVGVVLLGIKNGLYYGVEPSSGAAPDDLKDRWDEIGSIYKTFKFINQENINNWDVYRNEEYGFELKFPPAWKGVKIEKRLYEGTYQSVFYSNYYIEFTYPFKIKGKEDFTDPSFGIYILDEKTWKIMHGLRLLAIVNGVYYSSSRFNGAIPDELEDRANEVDLIINTFKIIK